MSINEAITKAIQENLPAATAGELKKYLDEAQKTHADYIYLIEVAESRNAEIVILTNRIAQLESSAKIHGDLKGREKALCMAENNLKVTIAESKIIEAEKRADAIYNLASIAFRNRSIVKMVSKDTPVFQTQMGGAGYTHNMQGTETHTEQEIDDLA